MGDIEREGGEPVELADYLRVIKQRWWIILLAVVVVTGAAIAVSLNSTPQYRSFARLLYQKTNLEQALFGAQVFAAPNPDREVQTGAMLVQLEPLAEGVKSQLKLARSAAELLGMVSAETKGTTNVVDISAVSSDPLESANVANAFADQFVLFRQNTDRATVAAARELVKQKLDSLSTAEAASDYGLMLKEKYESLLIIESMQNGGFTIVQRASAPTAPFAPQTTRNAILGAVVGLLLGVGLAFLLDRLDRRVRDDKTLESELGAPVLANVPLTGFGWRARLSGDLPYDGVGFDKRPATLEAFRTLRSNLEYFVLDNPHHCWLITSGLPQEGKTTTTINLAFSLALSGKRVIIIEGDLRRPMTNQYLGLARTPGLSNLLAGTKRPEEVLQMVRTEEFALENGHKHDNASALLERNVYAIASGPLPPNPAELLASERMADLMKKLTARADCVLIDTPPVLAVSDALTLARHADGVIIVARLGSSQLEEIREVRDIFERAGARIIGVVAGGTGKNGSYYRKQGYNYGYGK